VAWESISTQIGQRLPVLASITTTGALPRLYWPMWLIGTAPVALTSAAVSMPGTLSRIVEPGLNPSAASYGVASMWTPNAFAGIPSVLRSTRRPVGLVLSGRV
jgi:hypothetical protein